MKPKDNYTQLQNIVNSVIEKINQEEENCGVALQLNARRKSPDRNFVISHREEMASFLEAGGDVYGKVKAHIVRNMRLDCNLYFGSINTTSEATGVSKSTVQRVLLALQESDSIRFYMDGIWAVNPRFLRNGAGAKYIGQMRFYHSLTKRKREEKDSALAEKIKELY